MVNTNQNKTEETKGKSADEKVSYVCNFVLFVLFMIFPLILHDGYFDVLQTKYYFFCVVIVSMIVSVLTIRLITFFRNLRRGKDKQKNQNQKEKGIPLWKRT